METTAKIPPVLLFRIESSILQDAQVQEIILPSQALREDGGMGTSTSSATVATIVGGRDDPWKVSTRMESAGPFPVHVFAPEGKSETTNSSESKSHNWLWQGSTTSGKRVVIQTAKELKELGTKARARLEEEKMKRPEIQLLDHVQTSDPEKNKTRKTTSFSTNISSQKNPSGTKRKLDTPALQSSSRKKPSKPISKKQQPPNSTKSRNVQWVPDVSHIETPSKEQQSAAVKLHGIPMHCTTEHVKKFFAGLPVEKITIVLPNNVTIKSLDGLDSHQRRAPDNIDVRLRVLVHFASSLTAALACDRSGETMTIRNEQDQEETFVVAITILSKDVAHALSLVSVPSRPNTTFGATVDRLIAKLHPMVDKILWSVTSQRKLNGNLPLEASIQRAEIILSKTEAESLLTESRAQRWQTNPVYGRVAKHYNRLVDVQDELIHQVPYPMIDTIGDGSRKGTEPVVELTTRAYKALDAELAMIEGLLYQARVHDLIGD